MRPLLHPYLVNGRSGDPAIYVETLFERRALLFDLGDITALPPRKIQRLEHVFVSHAHIDHFFGFDRLLRVLAGRESKVRLYGPGDFIDHVRHKLQAYRWNLVDRYLSDLVFVVTEIDASLATRTAQFRLKTGFSEESGVDGRIVDGVLLSEPTFRVAVAVLEHRTACLGFALEEAQHVNVWKNRLAEQGLPVGPWLNELKRAILANRPDDHRIRIVSAASKAEVGDLPLGALREAVTITAGQKIAYVTDAADTAANRTAIVKLARGADILFIEATFALADAALATERAHLTTAAAGEIARAAEARRIEPFHFSRRYEGDEQRLLDEVMAAFRGPDIRRAAL